MINFSRLFGKAPFDHLQTHMEKVVAVLAKLTEMLQIFEEKDMSELERLANEVSELEHEADLIKNDIRASLSSRKKLMFSFDRSHILEILAVADDLADVAEDIAGHLTLKKLTPIPDIREDLKLYISKNMDTAWIVKEIIFQFDDLIEASFGGRIAESVQEKIHQTAYNEHEVDVIHRRLLRHICNNEEHLSTSDFYLWIRLVEDIGHISHISEKLGLRVEMLLDLK